MTIHSAIPAAHCGCDAPRHVEGLLSVAEAVEVARSLVTVRRVPEAVPLGEACGRIAAQDVYAPRPMPFFDQSAMDGFAVRLADLVGAGPWHLEVVATVAAGDGPPGGDWEAGAAVRIFTGTPVPPGTDAIVMVEDCEDEGGFVTVRHRPRAGENIRPKGSDIACGALLVAAGTVIEPRHVGLLAANGFTALDVCLRPRVGVFSTGSELVSRAAPEQGRIFDANRPMLIALAQSCGAEVIDLGIVDDDAAATAHFFSDHADAFDLLLSSGAVSAGARDFVRTAFTKAGGAIHAWKVALKPGKPALFGALGRTAYFGLPGNPLSAFVGFELFVREQVLRLAGTEPAKGNRTHAIAGYTACRKTGRTEVVPVRVASRTLQGVPVVEALGNGSSGTLHALCQADGLAVIPAAKRQIAPGDALGFITFCRSPEAIPDGEFR